MKEAIWLGVNPLVLRERDTSPRKSRTAPQGGLAVSFQSPESIAGRNSCRNCPHWERSSPALMSASLRTPDVPSWLTQSATISSSGWFRTSGILLLVAVPDFSMYLAPRSEWEPS